MPETLQKLHESSKTLETNQTAISQKISEVQQRIETVEKEVSLYFMPYNKYRVNMVKMFCLFFNRSFHS